MKTLLVGSLLITLLAFSSLGHAGPASARRDQAWSSKSVKEALVAKEKWACETDDSDALIGILTDDGLAVYDTGIQGGSALVQSLKGTFNDWKDYKCSEEMVRFMPIGKEAALIVFKVGQQFTDHGKQIDRHYYYSALWVKQHGKWRRRFWQETDIKP